VPYAQQRDTSLPIGKRGIQECLSQLGIGWGAQGPGAPEQTRPDAQYDLDLILADQTVLPIPIRPRHIPWAWMQDQDI